ncbi:hypothetical protein EDC04DRAFT_2775826 [Pisolithus marmoratus]|nr:hypothetical protein EDC04DRAFT_2775826 [Pisolithus marmoratus]
MGNYTLGKVIGEGAYGKVRIGTHRLTSTPMSASLTREIHHHRQLHHPHVTQMYEVIATESYIWIVTELCCGGELFDYLAEKGRLSEDEARIIFGQLCLAVALLHDKGIRCRVKLGDFGSTREAIMREKVIHTRDLIRNILQIDPSKRLTIPQILSSPWFTAKDEAASKEEPVTPSVSDTPFLTVQPTTTISELPDNGLPSASSTTSVTTDGTFVSASSNILPPVTSDNVLEDPFLSNDEVQMHPNLSQSTITKTDRSTRNGSTWQPVTPIEEEDSAPSMRSSVSTARVPPHPTRTPARTKRRSVSSGLSENGTQFDSPVPLYPPQDFASLLKTPTPIIFSTPAERELLNALSALGFDTAQIVHSVLSDACDAAGAIWWMLMRKHEKRIVDEVRASSAEGAAHQSVDGPGSSKSRKDEEHRASSRKRMKSSVAVQTDESERLAPEFAVVPPTPTVDAVPRPCTPPRAKSPFLSPSPTTAESSGRSNPSTPSGSARDGKVRSGSISIMQRATTALGAAGLEKEKTKDHEKKMSGDDPRSSHGSGGSAKLTKSPPARVREGPAVPAPQTLESSAIPGSPWVVAGGRTSPQPDQTPTAAASKDDTLNDGSRVAGGHRNRASILSTLRLWFNEDRKGKRKEPTQLPQNTHRELTYSRAVVGPPSSSIAKTPKVAVKRRTSDSGRGRRVKRASLSSRRSSSVNSRRSSVNSAQVFVLDQSHLEQIPSVRSLSGDTPNSEKGDPSSRPSSIQSFSQTGKHHKSPSAGSNGSASYYRTSSPLPKYQHRRHGSSSSTRVVRQIPSTPVSSSRPQHNRTNSAASSVHSLTSSRPASFYEVSEGEGTRTNSPFRNYPSRNSDENTPRRGAGTFIAQKRLTPFTSPHGSSSIGRTSWKKSWGNEPPGWQSRSTHLPVEVLVISPPPDIRDVFSAGGRPSLSLGDESDWVDEDEDVPEFAGGLGQMSGGSSSSKTNVFLSSEKPTPLILSPPRNHHSRGRTAKTRTSGVGRSRAKGGQSPVGRVSPALPQVELAYEPPETRGGRWQLPGVRGPTFRQAIQEEDEGEEE